MHAKAQAVEMQSEIVRSSDNDSWKVRLADAIADGDLLSRDVVYHNTCKIGAWRKFVQGPKRYASQSCVDISLVIAEIEFFDNLQEQIDSGEYITTVQAENLYIQTLEAHGILNSTITRRALPVIAKISENVSFKAPRILRVD